LRSSPFVVLLLLALWLCGPGAASAATLADLDRARTQLAAGDPAGAEHTAREALGATSVAQADALGLQLMLVQARALTRLGRRAEAAQLRAALLPRMEAEFGAGDLEVLEEWRALAVQYNLLDRPEAARSTARRAAAQARATTGPTSRATLMAEFALAQIEAARADPDAAATLALDVLARARAAGHDEEFLDMVRFAAAQTLRAARRYDEALPLLRESFEWRSRRLGSAAPATLDTGVILAWVTARTGQDELGLALATQLADTAARTLPAEHPTRLRVDSQRAELLAREGRYAEAMALYEDTAQRLAMLSRTSPWTADTIALYIEHALEAGHPAACTHLPTLRAAAAATAAGSVTHQNLADSEAYCLVLQGDPAGAQSALQARLHAQGVPRSGARIDHLMLGRRLAAIQIANGDAAAAQRLLTDTLAEAEVLRAESLLARRGGYADWVDTRPWAAGGRSLVRLLAAQGQTEAAFVVTERLKARELLDRQAQDAAEARLTPAQRARVQAARESLAAAQLAAALAPDAVAQAAAEGEVLRAEARLAQLARDLAPAATALPAPRPGELFVHAIADGDQVLLLVRDAQGQVSAYAAHPGNVDALVRAARRALGGETWPDHLWRLADGRLVESLLRPSPDALRVSDGAALGLLEAALAQPLAAHLKDAKRIVFAPDGATALLPIEALRVSGRPLGQQTVLSYAHSAHSASALALAAAAPRSGSTAARGLIALGVARPALQPAALDPRLASLRWQPLPAVDQEIATVARSLPGVPVKSLNGAAASESAVRALAASGTLEQARYLHVAAHAWYSDATPELSAIVLGEAQPGADPTAGYLTAAELRGLRLGAELVVLSACTSSGGAARSGEGLSGLAHALLATGAQGVVVSLWPVADAPTARLMSELYARLAQGQRPAQALAEARRALMQEGAPARDWAGFVYYGAP
jgi:CHAT domain-containing protein